MFRLAVVVYSLRKGSRTPGTVWFLIKYLSDPPEKRDRDCRLKLALIMLWSDQQSYIFSGPVARNEWNYKFYRNLSVNLKNNYSGFFSNEKPDAPICEEPSYWEGCHADIYVKGRKKGIGLSLIDSKRVALTYFDETISKETYRDFLSAVIRDLDLTKYSNDADDKGTPVQATRVREPIEAENGLTIKLD